MGSLHTVARKSDVPPGQGICADINGRRIAVFNVNDVFYAVDDECPHAGAPLSEGDVDGCQVLCPWHGAAFDLTDGTVQCPPAEEGIATYPVVIENDEIRVELP